MRNTILTMSLMVLTSQAAWCGFPVFHDATGTTGSSRPAVASPPSKAGGNWLTRLWKSDPKPADPQFFYQPPQAPPTTTERISSAITDNAAVRTARNWLPSENAQPPQQVDTLSLEHAVGKPTPQLLLSMAQIRESNKDVEGAREFYFKALAANPKRVQTLREFGHFEDRQNRLVEAERYYTQAVQIEPRSAPAQNDLALCLARQEKYAHAAQVLDRTIALAPAKPLYRNNMATVLMQLGEQHQAMQHLMAVHPPAAAYYNMGHLLEQHEQGEAARAHYAEALRLDPAITPAEKAIARLSHNTEPRVPQTAMATQEPAETASDTAIEEPVAPLPASLTYNTQWPSTPITPQTTTSSRAEPEFGPQLLPPLE